MNKMLPASLNHRLKMTHIRHILPFALVVIASAQTALGGMSYLKVGWYADYQYTAVVQGNANSGLASAWSADWQGGSAFFNEKTAPFICFALEVNPAKPTGWFEPGSLDDSSLTPSGPGAYVYQSGGLHRAADLYREYSPGILNLANNNEILWADKEKGTALQLAIWEVLFDSGKSGYSISESAGNDGFYVTSLSGTHSANVLALANSMLSWEAGRTVDPSLVSTYLSAVNNNGGSRLGIGMLGPSGLVPEPSTCLAGLLLILPFLAGLLRSKR